MAYTTDQIDAIITTLETAMSGGAAEVMFDGRRIVYRSQDEITKAIAYFSGLRLSAAGTTRSRQIRMFSDKGL